MVYSDRGKCQGRVVKLKCGDITQTRAQCMRNGGWILRPVDMPWRLTCTAGAEAPSGLNRDPLGTQRTYRCRCRCRSG